MTLETTAYLSSCNTLAKKYFVGFINNNENCLLYFLHNPREN